MLDTTETRGHKPPEVSITGENPKDRIGAKKPALSLVPAVAIAHTAHAFMDGAEKYGPYNWREKKVRALVYLDAAKRHIDAFLDGEETASDSGVHHLGHAMACLAILLDAQETGNLVDDRPIPGAAASVLKRLELVIRDRAHLGGESVDATRDWREDWRGDQPERIAGLPGGGKQVPNG